MKKLAIVANWLFELVGGFLFLLLFVGYTIYQHIVEARRCWLGWRDECAFWVCGTFCFTAMAVCYLPSQVSDLAWRLKQLPA